MSCLHILEINLLLVTLLENIFSHPVGCLLIFFMVSFAVQKLLSLIRCHLLVLVLIFITLGSSSKKILLQFMPKSVLLMISSMSFMIFGLPLSSLIHFEYFFFVYGVRECFNLILLHVAAQFSQHHLLKGDYLLFIIYPFLLCQGLIDHKCMGLFLGCSIDLYVCFCACTILF